MYATPNRQTAPKHVLISVVGLSPQVITETLYCYWCLASPPVPITEVFALTTLRGKQALEETLLGDNGKGNSSPSATTTICHQSTSIRRISIS